MVVVVLSTARSLRDVKRAPLKGLRGHALLLNDGRVIHPTKNAAGEFDGSMNFDPELLTFGGEINVVATTTCDHISMLYDGKTSRWRP
jgi:hypothetical protein